MPTEKGRARLRARLLFLTSLALASAARAQQPGGSKPDAGTVPKKSEANRGTGGTPSQTPAQGKNQNQIQNQNPKATPSAGKPAAKPPARKKPEDEEVIRNLELLMMMEMLNDYDLVDDAPP